MGAEGRAAIAAGSKEAVDIHEKGWQAKPARLLDKVSDINYMV